MTDHRVDPVVRVMCQFFGLCDCNGGIPDRCFIDKSLVENVILAADQADRENGIVRVHEIPTTEQGMAGLACMFRNGTQNSIYREMIKVGIIKAFRDV